VKTFGQRVRHARLRCGWTQRELAAASGLTQSAIGNYESGQRVEPTAAALLKLAQALRVSPAWLNEGARSGESMSAVPRERASASNGRGQTGTRRGEGIWPFRSVEYETYANLSLTEKRMLESMVATFINSCAGKNSNK
jgi:transcriptional regulator with XRE-family HTH domain